MRLYAYILCHTKSSDGVFLVTYPKPCKLHRENTPLTFIKKACAPITLHHGYFITFFLQCRPKDTVDHAKTKNQDELENPSIGKLI